MIPVPAFKDRSVAVFGLARSGITAAKALIAGGANVHAWDDNEASRERAAAEGVPVTDLNKRDWSDLAALVLSPGVPLTHPEPHRMVQLARATDTPVIGDIELFALTLEAMPPAERPRVVGITGTNGKSTTTALTGHILHRAGLDVRVGGNIGRGVLDLDAPYRGAVYVIELSSYQLDLTHSLRCHAAALINLEEDHLDRHGDMEGYARAKMRIFANQQADDFAVVGVDDPMSRRIANRFNVEKQRRVVPVSASRALSRGVYALGGGLYDSMQGSARKVADLTRALALPGRHNAQNAAVAYSLARRFDISAEIIAEALVSFPGLAHRIEVVGRRGEVLFVNDSKATNADAAKNALAVYDDIFWIAGGRAKKETLAKLKPYFPRIAKAYLIGEAAKSFSDQIRGEVDVDMSGDLETAVARASADAAASGRPNPVVLLSPACASFDQFKDFEDRGDAFRGLVAGLSGVNPRQMAEA